MKAEMTPFMSNYWQAKPNSNFFFLFVLKKFQLMPGDAEDTRECF